MKADVTNDEEGILQLMCALIFFNTSNSEICTGFRNSLLVIQQQKQVSTLRALVLMVFTKCANSNYILFFPYKRIRIHIYPR